MSRHHFASHLLLLLLPGLVACGQKTAVDPRTQDAVVRTASVRNSSDSNRSFTGIVAARVQSDLGFRVSGKVLERLVDTGQTVKRGQPLMRIDPVDLQLSAHAQQETVAAARARAKQTADDEARYRDLVSAGAVSASAYDLTKAAADSAAAQLKAAEAQADVARNASGYAVLLADTDGVVVDTPAEAGQVVSAGQVVIRIAQAGQREAIVQFPETLRPAVGSEASATLYGQQGPAVPARLRQLSDAADRQTRTFEARYVLKDALANAPLGATVSIQITDSHKPGDLQVPVSAIFDPGTGSGVWIIRGNPSHVSWLPVKVLGLGDTEARVTGKLKVGDKVVVLGAHLLKEGQKVKAIDTATPGPVTGNGDSQ